MKNKDGEFERAIRLQLNFGTGVGVIMEVLDSQSEEIMRISNEFLEQLKQFNIRFTKL